MEPKNDLTELNNIHDLLVDSRKGYLEASERVEDPRVKELLASFSAERAALELEVDGLIQSAEPGKEHREGGTIKGDLHRAWMDLRDALSKSENANVLNECERGEGYLLTRYEEILKKEDLLPRTRQVMEGQRAHVQNNLARITALRKVFENVE